MARFDIKGAIVSDAVGWIYDWLEIPNATPKKLLEAIENAKTKGEPLDVYINSPGGDVSAGAEMYAALQEYGDARIHVIQACSAASVVMCASKSDITPVGMVMLHNVSMATKGDNRAMEHASDVLKTADKAIAAAYVQKTRKPMDEILGLMAKETWLTAEDAVKLGLCDLIAQPKSIPQMVAAAETMLPLKTIEAMQRKRMVAISQLELLKLQTGETI